LFSLGIRTSNPANDEVRGTVLSFKGGLPHLHYGSMQTTVYERLLINVFGSEEKFIAFEQSDEFVEWCAANGVSMVLHGHKHIPRQRNVLVKIGGDMKELMIVGCGSTTGAEGKPMCYDVVAFNPQTKKWNVSFFHDERRDGSGFRVQSVKLDFRQ
jgi:hypothetical protein